MIEEEIFQLAHKWATHEWYKADLELRKNPDNELVKEKEQKAWARLIEIESLAEERGYTL